MITNEKSILFFNNCPFKRMISNYKLWKFVYIDNKSKFIYKNYMFFNYKKPYSKEKIKTFDVCSLFDVSSIPITVVY
jgi:uncharacterized protein YwgA